MPNRCSWGIKSISFTNSPGGWKPFCFLGRVFLHKTVFFSQTWCTSLKQSPQPSPNYEGAKSKNICFFVFVGLWFMKPTFDLLKVGFLRPNLFFLLWLFRWVRIRFPMKLRLPLWGSLFFGGNIGPVTRISYESFQHLLDFEVEVYRYWCLDFLASKLFNDWMRLGKLPVKTSAKSEVYRIEE